MRPVHFYGVSGTISFFGLIPLNDLQGEIIHAINSEFIACISLGEKFPTSSGCADLHAQKTAKINFFI